MKHVNKAVLSKVKKDEVRTNRLLGAMEPASRERIYAHLEPIFTALLPKPAPCGSTIGR